jgi:hypothetical protein
MTSRKDEIPPSAALRNTSLRRVVFRFGKKRLDHLFSLVVLAFTDTGVMDV